MVLAATMESLLVLHKMTKRPKQEFSAAQQYREYRGLRLYGEQGKQALVKEMSQQHKRECFIPRHRKSLTQEELKKAQEAITFLTKKA